MSAREIDDSIEGLEIKLIRVRKEKKYYMALYRFENPRIIADIIAFLNSKSKNQILEGYITMIEKLAAEELAREDCIERLGERIV